eukprot:TRINITY_DN4354_c0_g1_i1.p2 TRINITY_DN4354_c0_g1~~TRINITY_DN4354_c0_g1_i1.p2  ORF type:complete len:149 (-),score=21.03 TRINITY_DN4354_c0_g1_i1:295-678(-)
MAATAVTAVAPPNPCRGPVGRETASAFVAYTLRASRASAPLGRLDGRVPALVPWRPRAGAAGPASAAAVTAAPRASRLPAVGAPATLRDLAAALGLDLDGVSSGAASVGKMAVGGGAVAGGRSLAAM